MHTRPLYLSVSRPTFWRTLLFLSLGIFSMVSFAGALIPPAVRIVWKIRLAFQQYFRFVRVNIASFDSRQPFNQPPSFVKLPCSPQLFSYFSRISFRQQTLSHLKSTSCSQTVRYCFSSQITESIVIITNHRMIYRSSSFLSLLNLTLISLYLFKNILISFFFCNLTHLFFIISFQHSNSKIALKLGFICFFDDNRFQTTSMFLCNFVFLCFHMNHSTSNCLNMLVF